MTSIGVVVARVEKNLMGPTRGDVTPPKPSNAGVDSVLTHGWFGRLIGGLGCSRWQEK